eukprot:comp5257_c0_seq1/m.1292 comp5257_c0_seq1/g.1292  ORF comp5257_c0_seq1/g.1292 comp5257_c0_seq1/m.1292 type:complete len:173 (-) comp5257_c0_seq1:49-567(-)
MPGFEWSEDDRVEFVLCARYGEEEEVKAYLDRGIPMDCRDGNGNTALHMAAANGHAEVVQLLLTKCTRDDVNATNEPKNTPLHWAALNGHRQICELLVKAGADINVQNGAGHSPLYEALSNNREDVSDYLMGLEEQEAQANRSRGDGNLANGEEEPEEGKSDDEGEEEEGDE